MAWPVLFHPCECSIVNRNPIKEKNKRVYINIYSTANLHLENCSYLVLVKLIGWVDQGRGLTAAQRANQSIIG